MRTALAWAAGLTAAMLTTSQFISVFVVPPIGAVPEGRTLIIVRMPQLNFIDSADGWCARHLGGVSLLCRGATLGKVTTDGTILLRLPYSEALHSWSTDGKRYEL